MAGKKGAPRGEVKPKIYVIQGPSGAHLVESKTEAGALAHVIGKAYKARLATQRDVYEAALAGVKVEVVVEPKKDEAE